MSAEFPASELLQAVRLLYNLPGSMADSAALAERPLEAVARLPLKQDFSPDRFDPLPPGRPPAASP